MSVYSCVQEVRMTMLEPPQEEEEEEEMQVDEELKGSGVSLYLFFLMCHSLLFLLQ